MRAEGTKENEAMPSTEPSILVLISHSNKDKALAEALIELLRSALGLLPTQIRCTSVDGYRLPAGVNVNDQLRAEIKGVGVLIGLLTSNSIDSTYVLFELGARWGAELFMIPLLAGLTPERMQGPQRDLNAVSCDSEPQLIQLVEDIGRQLNLKVQSAAAYLKHARAVKSSAENIPAISDQAAREVLEKLTTVLDNTKVETTTIQDDLAENVSVFPLHRRIVAEELYEASFKSAKELIYVTIMSKHTLLKMPERIRCAKDSHTVLNVLTWDPNVGLHAIRAFGKHLGEETTAQQQIREAYAGWQKLARENPTVIKQAGSYLSSPTMQGVIVLDDWALIELIPYHTTPIERPAMFLSASVHVHLFPLFQSAFKALLQDSTPIAVA